MFQKAVKKQLFGRIAFIGPAKSGKTYTALAVATNMCQRVAVIDTENRSASKYADIFNFDVSELASFEPSAYIAAIAEAEAAGYDGLVIDSLSHAWIGKGGILATVDHLAKTRQTDNTFRLWREVTPMHNALVDKIIYSQLHIFATIRSKIEYVMEKNERTGKSEVRKIGLQPVQRDGLEYEFDVVGDVNPEHELIIQGSRCPELSDKVFPQAGKDVALIFKKWLGEGEAVAYITESQYNSVVAQADQHKIIDGVRQLLQDKYHVPTLRRLTTDQFDNLVEDITILIDKKEEA